MTSLPCRTTATSTCAGSMTACCLTTPRNNDAPWRPTTSQISSGAIIAGWNAVSDTTAYFCSPTTPSPDTATTHSSVRSSQRCTTNSTPTPVTMTPTGSAGSQSTTD